MGKPKRKRVCALRRAPDGSAFQTCKNCGKLVAVAIADMHECKPRSESIKEKNFDLQAQPRSAFRFFMESFVESIEIINYPSVEAKGFETWRNMSEQERLPYFLQAEKVNSEYDRALIQEAEDIIWVNEEADSAEVGRFDKKYYNSSSDDEPVPYDPRFWLTSACLDSTYWYFRFLLPDVSFILFSCIILFT